jgi:hypothetical protein
MNAYIEAAGKKFENEPGKCRVVAVYNHLDSRALAVRVCEDLAQQFKDDVAFEFSWWGFKYLKEPGIAHSAMRAATKADLIFISPGSTDELPSEVKAWFDSWLPQRQALEGALVVLRNEPAARNQRDQDQYLKLMAQRADMDFLPVFCPIPAPPSGGRLWEDQPGLGAARPGGISAGEERISHWGINE